MPEEKRRRRRVRGAPGLRSAATPRNPPRPPPGSSGAVPEAFGGLAPRLAPPGMALPEWHIAVKLADQPLAPKSILRLPETELGECPLGGCSISCLKQLITGRLQESVPDPELIGRSRAGGGLCERAGAPGGVQRFCCSCLSALWGRCACKGDFWCSLLTPACLRERAQLF